MTRTNFLQLVTYTCTAHRCYSVFWMICFTFYKSTPALTLIRFYKLSWKDSTRMLKKNSFKFLEGWSSRCDNCCPDGFVESICAYECVSFDFIYSAALFYIVRNKHATVLTVNMRNLIINTLINSMQLHRTDETMLRNGCLTLCQFRIPQDIVSNNYWRLPSLSKYFSCTENVNPVFCICSCSSTIP